MQLEQTENTLMPQFTKRMIGDCTMYCGDSIDLLNAGIFGKIGAIVSDPPYGISFSSSTTQVSYSKNAIGKTVGNKKNIIGDDKPFDPKPWVDAAPLQIDMKSGREQKRIIIFGADNCMQRLPTGGTMLAWDKNVGRGPDDDFCDCEWMWVGRSRVKREVFRYLWKGIISSTTPLDLPPPGEKNDGKKFARVHISQKPVELMRWCIDKVRPISGLPILDPYMGSGSTAIAALSFGMSFVGCEIDAGHYDVACRRVEAFYARQGGIFDVLDALPDVA